MKIEIEKNGEKITLTNKSIDNYNFVDVIIGNESVTVAIDELYSAIKGFYTLKELHEDKNSV